MANKIPVLNARPKYTDAQLAQYLEYVYGPSHAYSKPAALRDAIATEPLEALTSLQRRHLVTIPWGSLALHYSPTKKLSLDVEDLFQKLVVRKLGGYCMEMNTFLSTVLRSLGVKLYITGGRISHAVLPSDKDPNTFQPLEHMMIIATLNGRQYHMDVGFANFGTWAPLPLEDGATAPGVPGIDIRLSHRAIAEFESDQKIWVLETRDATSQTWKAGYCFTDREFLPQDFNTFNYRTMTDPTSMFTFTLIMTRFVAKEGAPEEVEGTMTLVGDTVRRRIGGGAAEVLVQCKSEEERIEALKKWFGIELLEDEIKGIVGTSTEIKS